MHTDALPPRPVMVEAFLGRDPAFDGLFLTAVRTTGVFCRPVCPARKPAVENLEFYPTPRAALEAGYRPCLRCRPMAPPGAPPEWLQPLLEAVQGEPARRWTDADLEARGLSPERVRRWFKKHHGTTFHAWSRARRLGEALGRIRHGEPVTRAAFGHGWDSLSGFHEAFRSVFGTDPTGAARSGAPVRITRIPTPLGPVLAGATDDALCMLEFVDRRRLETQLRSLRRRMDAVFVPGSTAVTDRAAAALEACFDGRAPDPVPLRLTGTDFQRAVWDALRSIPRGETRSYADVARAVGRPAAARAVGRAVGENRIAVLVPCHRVVGSDGRLTGYGAGLWRKRRLLELEGAPVVSPTPG